MKGNKLSILTFMLVGLLVYSSCRKADITLDLQLTQKAIEEKFFNSHRTADPTEKKLVDFIKNNKEHFVEKTVKQIGFPRWDKIVAIITKSRIAGRGNSDSSLATYYVPFVRDSQNFVNAAMVIKTYPSDTTFSYTCDWQYSQRQNNLNSYADSAEYHAIFFMVLDKKVFGHSLFDIIDTTLFKHNNHKPIRVRLDNVQIGGSNKLSDQVEFCQIATIYWQNCPWNNTNCGGPGGTCDNCPTCTSSLSYLYCWTEWIDNGETGGGSVSLGGGGSPSGGGWGWDPSQYQKTIFDTYSGDEDNNTIGDIDTTTYQPYQLGQPWNTVANVISVSDFVGWGTPGFSKDCMSYAKGQIAKKNKKISNYFTVGQTIQLYTSANGADSNAVKDGIGYLISALNRGIPVIVGVDVNHGSSNPLTDNTTDHFIVIVGMGSNAIGNYFTFFDNASGYSNQGANPGNKLYFNPVTWELTGQSQTQYFTDYASYDYILTMIRKSK